MKLEFSLPLAALFSLAAALPAQLSGTYAVGVGGNYPDIAPAVTALNTSGVSGPVTFLVTTNDNSGPWTISAFTGQGAANPVTFAACFSIRTIPNASCWMGMFLQRMSNWLRKAISS